MLRGSLLLPWFLLAALGCNRASEASAPPKAEKGQVDKAGAKNAARVGKETKAAAHQTTVAEAHGDEDNAPEDKDKRYAVPFAWEASAEEPLSQTRSFLRDALSDNQSYMDHGNKFFQSFADSQRPRATVVSCSDSRVHSQAWDASPENDEYLVRNLGNVIENSEGSVAYGVEYLNTPLLLIVGHTGCGVIKSALTDITKQGKAVERELKAINLPKPARDKSENDAWLEGTFNNVHNQVSYALQKFGTRIQQGQLTVVGAIYDFRNELRQGAGRLIIIDVNGNRDPARMDAFINAIVSGNSELRQKLKTAAKGKEISPTSAALKALREVPGIVAHPVSSEAEARMRDRQLPAGEAADKAKVDPGKAKAGKAKATSPKEATKSKAEADKAAPTADGARAKPSAKEGPKEDRAAIKDGAKSAKGN